LANHFIPAESAQAAYWNSPRIVEDSVYVGVPVLVLSFS